MVMKLQTQTNMTNNIQHQDTETSIHKIWPNQMIQAQKQNDLTYWKETTEKQSKLECYLALKSVVSNSIPGGPQLCRV